MPAGCEYERGSKVHHRDREIEESVMKMLLVQIPRWIIKERRCPSCSASLVFDGQGIGLSLQSRLARTYNQPYVAQKKERERERKYA